MAIMASAPTSLVIASSLLVCATSRFMRVAMLRARALYWRTTFAVQNSAPAVWSAVRFVLAAPPSDFTSSNASTQVWLRSDGGGSGRNWSGRLSMNGRTFAIHGICGGAYAVGVSRHTPGLGGRVANDEVVPI